MKKERIFIAHRVTGEDFKKLEIIVRKICNSVGEAGYNHYCTFLEEMANPNKFNNWKPFDYLMHSIKELDKSDTTLLFVNSEDKSEGMLIEVGYSLAKKKKLVLVINKKLKNTYLRGFIDNVIEFNSVDEACNKIRSELK